MIAKHDHHPHRRDFLRRAARAGASLIIGFCWPAAGAQAADDTAQTTRFSPNAWLEIDRQGHVTLWIGRAEIGQGSHTSIAMIMADELGANWSQVSVKQGDVDEKYGEQLTGGSYSTRYAWANLRKPAAAAREMLVAAAAQIFEAPPSECFAAEGAVTHRPSGRRLSFGGLVAAASTRPVPAEPSLRDPSDYRIIGTPRDRLNNREIVTGTAQYGLDARVPGMLYAVIVRSPVFGGKLKRFDAAQAKRVTGVRHVVEVPSVEMPIPFDLKPGGQGHQHFLSNGVAVVADSTWAAIQGRLALRVEWDEGVHAAESSASMMENFRQLARGTGRVLRSTGNADAAFAAAAKKVEAEYELPLLAHAPMEPPNCTAWVRDGSCELWAPTQNAPGVRAALATALELPASAITIHITLIGGGFGRRLNMDYAVEAALVSKVVGAPVKVVWTRDDDLQHDYYRAAGSHRIRAGLDEQNRVVAWLHHLVLPTTTSFYEGKDGPDDDGSDIAGGDMRGGTVPHFQVEYTDPRTGVPRGWWRAVDSTGNLFVQQSFVDEVATAAGKDPLALRRELLGEAQEPAPKPGRFNLARLRKVFDLAAEKSGWGNPLPARRGRGIAGQFGFGSYVVQVAEVSVGKGGSLKVHRIVCAADIGRPINPDMVKAQMEGAIVFGLTAALHGAITIERGRVKQSNFHDYPMLRINEMPVIEVHIVPSQEPPGGVGEPGVPPVAPAVANAIFAASGKRVRRLPIRPADLA